MPEDRRIKPEKSRKAETGILNWQARSPPVVELAETGAATCFEDAWSEETC